jgi:hypothetical protein
MVKSSMFYFNGLRDRGVFLCRIGSCFSMKMIHFIGALLKAKTNPLIITFLQTKLPNF